MHEKKRKKKSSKWNKTVCARAHGGKISTRFFSFICNFRLNNRVMSANMELDFDFIFKFSNSKFIQSIHCCHTVSVCAVSFFFCISSFFIYSFIVLYFSFRRQMQLKHTACEHWKATPHISNEKKNPLRSIDTTFRIFSIIIDMKKEKKKE